MSREDEEGRDREGLKEQLDKAISKKRDLQRAKKVAQAVKGAVQVARGGAAAAQGASAAGGLLSGGSGAVAGTAAAAGAISNPEISIPGLILIILFLLLIFIAAIFILLLNPSAAGGGNLTCANVGGTCQLPGACPAGSTPDTSGAQCNDPQKTLCCIPQQIITCADIGGNCTTQSLCQPPNEPNSVAKCTDAANPVCCVKPSTQPPLPFYCQYDKNFSTLACNIAKYGCDPTSLAMIAASFGLNYTPLTLSQANGNLGCKDPGTTLTQTQAALQKIFPSSSFVVTGNLVNNGALDPALVAKLTNQGYYILGLGCMTFIGNEPFGGHSIVIAGANANGTLKVYDPTYCSGGGLRTLDPTLSGPDMKSGGFCGSGNSGWYAAYGIKKI